MKYVLGAVCLLALLAVSILIVQGKEGRVYKLITKFVRPMISQPALQHTLDQAYAENFTDITKDSAWVWFQPQLIDWTVKNNRLELVTNQESVWWQNNKGAMLYRPIKGNFEVSVDLRARKASDVSVFTDTAFQFGGIILRDPAGERLFTSENYVFNVIGNRGSNGLQVESKSTHNGHSSVQGTDWPSGDVSLKIKRDGAHFILYAKPIEEVSWQQVQEYQRPDLPDGLQLGMIVYSYSKGKGIHDLNVSFENLKLHY